MSTQNITSIVPTEGGCIVTFQTHSQGEVSYFYSLLDGAAEILAGADPGQYSGQRLS